MENSGSNSNSALNKGRYDLIGRYDHSVDDKGRITLPSRFKDYFLKKETTELVITKNQKFQCLLLFAADVFYEEVNKLSASLTTEDFYNLQKSITNYTFNLDMDKAGRIIIPSKLREETRIEKEIIVKGVFKTIEIWSKEEFEKDLKSIRIDDLPKTIFT